VTFGTLSWHLRHCEFPNFGVFVFIVLAHSRERRELGDHTLRLWDLENGQNILVLEGRI
jgi:hypothetical protein